MNLFGRFLSEVITKRCSESMVVAWVFYFVYALLGIVVEISCNKSAIYKKINQVPILLIILSENNSLGNSVKKSVDLVCSGRLPLTISFCF